MLAVAPAVMAGPANIIAAHVECSGDFCRFHVTVQHDDTGRDHYADGIVVLDGEGKVLGHRPLRHPHVGQAEFTRTVQVLMPKGLRQVTIKAHDSVHGFDGEVMLVELPARNGS